MPLYSMGSINLHYKNNTERKLKETDSRFVILQFLFDALISSLKHLL